MAPQKNGTLEKDIEAHHGEKQKTAETKRGCCHMGPAKWCKMYFWEGQQLTDSHAKKVSQDMDNIDALPLHRRILLRYRRLLAPLIPAVFVWFFWFCFMIATNNWYLFPLKYYMSITMIFGSLLAGMTSVGGGAVAFPVMTLAFAIDPREARDFSLIIQSLGMSAASFSIFFMKVKIEWYSLILCSLGGIGGFILGIEAMDPYLTAAQKKIFFVSLWASFGSVLMFINRDPKRKTFDAIHKMNWWKGCVLVIAGILGGICTSFAGSGQDVCCFSFLTLLFRISEKVATPTSVILMAFNSAVGFYWRGVVENDISLETWQFFAVCAPIVVVGAPMGSFLGSHFHRLVLAAAVIIATAVALIGAYAIVKMTPLLIGLTVGILVGGVVLFTLLSLCGSRLVKHYEEEMEEEVDQKAPSRDINGLKDSGIHNEGFDSGSLQDSKL